MNLKQGPYVPPALRARQNFKADLPTLKGPTEHDSTGLPNYEGFDAPEHPDPFSLIHRQWREGIARRAAPIESLINGLTSDLPIDHNDSLIKSYIAVRLELVKEYVNQLNTNELKTETDNSKLQLRRLLTSECEELSSKIQVWNINQNPQLQSLALNLHSDFMCLLGEDLELPTKRTKLTASRYVKEEARVEEEKKSAGASPCRSSDFNLTVQGRCSEDRMLNLHGFRSSFGQDLGQVEGRNVTVIRANSNYRSLHRIDPKTGRWKSRRGQIV
ncbi:hypothetical protein PMZ80_001193 [Knufia obscura]|uniref:Uncharacterized protein n=1 Tax=Knufia obscura TaxID=1635080 RepID=A0ABR0S2Z8_9EURO|nr:hypothetical protein PMZ80_001193 [Knufia obscura]